MTTICVHWPRLGPYHVARLVALHELLASTGTSLALLETAERDGTYAWERQSPALPFAWHRAFPGRALDSLGVREMESGVSAALDRIDPDAVAITSYSHPDARASLAWCRRRRRIAVLMTDSKADDAPRSRWREWTKRQLVEQYDAAVVAGAPHAAYVASLGMPQTHVFRPVDVVDNDRYARGAEAARRDADAVAARLGVASTPFFLGIGRLIPRKNFALLVRAYGRHVEACTKQQLEPWPLVIVGDGPEGDALRELADAEARGLVTFTGFRQIDDIIALLGLAGCLVHPATQEQWGLVVNEAMAAGVPVLVSQAAGCARDLVVDGVTGFRFDPSSITELARRLDAMRSMPVAARHAMAEEGRRRIDSYRPEDFAAAVQAAVIAGQGRADRGLSPMAGIVMGILRVLSRDTRAFHSIPD